MTSKIGFVDCAMRSPAGEGNGGSTHSHGDRREVVVVDLEALAETEVGSDPAVPPDARRPKAGLPQNLGRE